MIPAVLIYLLKANIALALVFLAYRLGLRRLTFYTLNRIFLLMGIVISSAFPLVDINPFVARHEEIGQVLTYVPDFSQLHQQQFNYWNILVYIFWAGVMVMLVRMLIQSFSMWRIHKSAVNGEIDGTQVKLLNKAVNPFSFFRNIYINPTLHQPQELQEILNHEQVHVRQWHSIDVVLGEINHIFYWFNPGAWLMRSAIRENLEFITDRYLIRQGIDKKSYQYNLLKISGIPYATAIANNFNFSHLKNRIMMMNKKRSSTFNMLRYVILGAMVGGIVLSLNYSKAAAIVAPLHILPVEDTTAPKKVAVDPAPVKEVTTAKATPSNAKAIPANAKAVPVSEEPVKVTGEAEEVVLKLDSDDKTKHLKNVTIELPANFNKSDDKAIAVISPSEKMVMKGNAVFIAHKPNEQVTEVKATATATDPTAVTLTGKVAGIRVEPGTQAGTTKTVVVTGYMNGVNTNSDATSITAVTTTDNAKEPKTSIKLRGTANGAQPLIVYDGQIVSYASLEYIDPEGIASMSVLKGKSATDAYGNAGKNGVIIITSKTESTRSKQ
ncbi:M56 family metallopeptidase [Chitinophaga sp. Cy-1792]|uniref:M56 family metallopeptidase n=1 Tax=Chitinophaga sp. Cy-1792 TaxID=2608339 RepID=UPI0014246583|nr:M56 family metallopeptidase [Chitinophaga sp. Cy-1792]NIG57169.1 TonB-dependent receptor plug domain-containing protein [Chitinophaga sp. Cy-1792]